MERGQIAEHNRKAYETAALAHYYARAVEEMGLFEEERAILARYGSAWAGKAWLDMGVGGGRTTPHFLDWCGRYVGIDFVEQMVRQCRRRYPDVDFRCCDARDLSEFDAGAFAVAWFSFNGIDYVSPDDRRQVLAEVYRVLQPGGAFVFSSHNLAVPPTTPSLRPSLVFDPNPLRLARRTLSLLRYHVADVLNYRRNRLYEVAGRECAVRVDAAHQYQLLTCYVAPRWQVEQLEALGFHDVTLFGRNGSFPDRYGDTLDPWLYYVAFKGQPPADSRQVVCATGPSP